MPLSHIPSQTLPAPASGSSTVVDTPPPAILAPEYGRPSTVFLRNINVTEGNISCDAPSGAALAIEQQQAAHEHRYRTTAPERLTDTRTRAERERDIRAGQRNSVRQELRWLTKGKRGLGLTDPRILQRIRDARRHHTASIERDRYLARSDARLAAAERRAA